MTGAAWWVAVNDMRYIHRWAVDRKNVGAIVAHRDGGINITIGECSHNRFINVGRARWALNDGNVNGYVGHRAKLLSPAKASTIPCAFVRSMSLRHCGFVATACAADADSGGSGRARNRTAACEAASLGGCPGTTARRWCGWRRPSLRNMMDLTWPKRIHCRHGWVTFRNTQKTGPPKKAKPDKVLGRARTAAKMFRCGLGCPRFDERPADAGNAESGYMGRYESAASGRLPCKSAR